MSAHITDCLKVYQPNLTKVRAGKANDGGYVLVRGVLYDGFFSGGIAQENSFELDVLNHTPPFIHCEAYDPAPGAGADHPRYHFHQEKFGYHGLREARNALVKMDIEGGEWEWLDRAPLGNIAQLVVEYHDPASAGWNWQTLHELTKHFYLIHAHGNSWGEYLDVDGVLIPQTLECTYIRKDLDPGLQLNKSPLPCHLDMSNLPHKPDLSLNWAPFVNP